MGSERLNAPIPHHRLRRDDRARPGEIRNDVPVYRRHLCPFADNVRHAFGHATNLGHSVLVAHHIPPDFDDHVLELY